MIKKKEAIVVEAKNVKDIHTLRAYLNYRGQLKKADRPTLDVPEIAKDEFHAGFLWAFYTKWQDEPLLMIGGCCLLLIQLVRGVLYFI